MKYLQKGPFTVSINGGDNYDATFGRKCFYCKKPLEPDTEEYENNAHTACDPDKKDAA